jgi:hypothetical protein
MKVKKVMTKKLESHEITILDLEKIFKSSVWLLDSSIEESC